MTAILVGDDYFEVKEDVYIMPPGSKCFRGAFDFCLAVITIVVETAERRFKRNTFRNFQAKGLKATHDCNNVGL